MGVEVQLQVRPGVEQVQVELEVPQVLPVPLMEVLGVLVVAPEGRVGRREVDYCYCWVM